ncbi:MAG: hypothetical protein PWQ67_2500 [Clostridia bacterium]|nr:hypothetical protein [Clostridia bacterium]MDN5324046.1 hypothetical protein [Clostridia bacterium]
MNSIYTMAQIAFIVMPIMFILRLAKEANLLNKISSYFEPLTKILYLSKEATFPLIVGIVFGLTYGAGVIVQAAKEGRLSPKDLILINVFLGLNHAIFEDTFLFAAIGANAWVMFITRTLLAILITYLLGKWLTGKEKKEMLLTRPLA